MLEFNLTDMQRYSSHFLQTHTCKDATSSANYLCGVTTSVLLGKLIGWLWGRNWTLMGIDWVLKAPGIFWWRGIRPRSKDAWRGGVWMFFLLQIKIYDLEFFPRRWLCMSSQADQRISGSAGQRRQKWCGCRWFGAKQCKAKVKNIIRCARPRTPQRRTSWGLSAWRTLTVSPLTSRLSFNLFPWGLCWSPNILDGSSTWRCVHPCWRLHPMRIHAGGTKLKKYALLQKAKRVNCIHRLYLRHLRHSGRSGWNYFDNTSQHSSVSTARVQIV